MVNYSEDFEEDDGIMLEDIDLKQDGASGRQESSKQEVVNTRQDSGTTRGDEAEGQAVSLDQGDADQGASSEKTEQKSTELFNGDVS